MSSDTKLTSADTLPDADSAAHDRAVLVLYMDDDVKTTRVIEIPDGAQMTVGRGRNAAIIIESERVSRIHARVTRKGAELAVEDAGSRNKTWVNGEAIDGRRVLVSGDEIVIGPATLLVSVTTRVAARTRVETGRRLEQVLAQEVDRGKRYRRSFSLLLLRFEGEIGEIDAAVERIAGRLRTMDVLAEYAPQELAIVFPELDAAAADACALEVTTAARTRRDGTPAAVTVTGGLAAFPQHGTTVGALVGRARSAVASVQGRSTTIAVPPEDSAAEGADVIVVDPQMRRVYELARKVADHPITVLLLGETGVGKEVVAAAIHHASARKQGPFIRLNCASVPDSLLESALFGHEKGAFTGADRTTTGYFQSAHGGTLFLDEIGEVSPAMQAKLLRVLENRRIMRVGATEEIEVDVRVVCATNRDLELESRRGAFRGDLFFRISGFTILVPPLRDRLSEIVPLAEHFLAQATNAKTRPVLAPAAAAALRSYSWPGNVRELRNAVERALVVRTGRTIELADLPDHIREHGGSERVDAIGGIRDRFAELERAAIIDALQSCNDNQTEAAKRLGISRRTLIYRMEKHGLKSPPASRG